MLSKPTNQNFLQFCTNYDFDPKTGVLINHSIVPDENQAHPQCHPEVRLLVEELENIAKSLPSLIENGLKEKVENLKNVAPNLNQNNIFINHMSYPKKMKILCLTFYVIAAYVKLGGTTIPSPLSELFFFVHANLQISKIPPGYLMCLWGWRWRKDDQPNLNTLEDLKAIRAADIQMRYTFSGDDGEHYFLGISVLFDIYLAKIIEILFEINNLFAQKDSGFEQEIIKRLEDCADLFENFIKNIMPEMDNLNADVFEKKIRPFVSSFPQTGILLENLNITLRTPGGSGGNAPSIQFFEALMQMTFSDPHYVKIQEELVRGYTGNQKLALDYLRKEFNIRDCSKENEFIAKAYNKLVHQYVNFSASHNQYIIRYILNMQNTQPTGFDAEQNRNEKELKQRMEAYMDRIRSKCNLVNENKIPLDGMLQ